MLIPNINGTNEIFHQLLSMLPFEPSLDTKIQQILMGNLLQYLQDTTSIYFTTKIPGFKFDPYILQAIR